MRPIYICIFLAVLTSCKRELEQLPPSSTTGSFFNTETEMNVALTGVYGSIMWPDGSQANLQFLYEQWADLGIHREAGLANGTYDTNASYPLLLWGFAYKTIQRANTLITGMEKGKNNVPADTYNRIQAEARILRAWAYYQLVFFFGDVPLITRPVLPEEYYTLTRTSRNDVIAFLYKELDEAAPALGWTPAARGRVSRAVAMGIKARIALYNGEYQLAADASRSIMDNAGLGLNPRFGDLFTRAGQTANAGKEIMFELMFSDEVTGANASMFIPMCVGSRNAGSFSGMFPTARMVDLFECTDGKRIDESPLYDPAHPSRNRDRRMKYTVAMPGDTLTQNKTTFVFEVYKNTTSFYNAAPGAWASRSNADFDNVYGPVKNGVGYLWTKYTFTDENIMTSKQSWIYMRYAEVLLTYAEASIELNKIDNSVIDAINKVRARAGQPTVAASGVAEDQRSLRRLIRRERTIELAMEAFRWFDIRRWKIADIVMPVKVLGAPKTAASVPVTPDFKTSDIADLNSIPVYPASAADDRFSRETHSFAPKYYLFPVPQSERDLNPNLTQNTGW